MSLFHAQAVTALRKVESGESLDGPDVAITVVALTRIIREGRTPFQRFRDHFIIGTERFPAKLSGLDYYRVILMQRKSGVWCPDSNMSEVSIFEVYTASQLDPPSDHNYDCEDSTPEEDACELLDRSHIGPSIGSSPQEDLDADGIALLRKYAADISAIDTPAAIEEREKLDHFLREKTPGSELIKQGDLIGMVDAHVSKYFFRGQLRTIRSPRQAVADSVRHATTYARKIMRENPRAAYIADHLEDHCRIGQICEYTGDWRWRF